jgi:hypothetical protein
MFLDISSIFKDVFGFKKSARQLTPSPLILFPIRDSSISVQLGNDK